MKKIILSLSIIGALTVGVGAITFAADNGDITVDESANISQEVGNTDENSDFRGNVDCPYYQQGGNPDCPYYEEGKVQGSGAGKGYGANYQNSNRRGCGGDRTGMMRYRSNL